jgi:dienelactone hydrolase
MCGTTLAQGISRTEAIPFESRTRSDAELLTAKPGTPTGLAGVLRLPAGNNARWPLVMLLHGSGGYAPYLDAWVERLTARGYATFVVDSFSGRGLSSVRDDQATLGRLAAVTDAYQALAVLAKHPRIDAARVALMGLSRGGQGALYAANARIADVAAATPAPRFAAHVALYPNCATRYLDDERLSAPVRVFHGTADDFNAAAPCAAYVQRLRAAGADADITLYPGAHHVFDWPGLATPVRSAQAQSMRECSVVETQPGLLVNAATQAPFSFDDDCVRRGTTAAYHADAARRVEADVLTFLDARMQAAHATPTTSRK